MYVQVWLTSGELRGGLVDVLVGWRQLEMYLQHANGEFQVAVGGDWHCGPDSTSPKKFRYDVQIYYPDDALDNHGFLIDNQCFKTYFDSLGYVEESCELLAKKCADHFNQLAAGKEWRVLVKIMVPDLADITYDEAGRPV